MTLPSSGPLSMSAINAEFGRGNDLNSYRGTTWYTDAGGSGTFSSGAISMSEFYGKRATSPATYVNPLGFNGNTYTDIDTVDGSTSIELDIVSDGTWVIVGASLGVLASGNWVTPTTAGIGTGKYVKFTLNSVSGTGGTWTNTTAWLQLSTTQFVQVTETSGTGGASRTRGANYTVQIATDSGGTNIVTSGTVTIRATASGIP